MPFAILAALSFAAAAPAPTYQEAVHCAAAYSVAASLAPHDKASDSDHRALTVIGAQWLAHAARSAARAGTAEGDVARANRALMHKLFQAGGVGGWRQALAEPVGACERMQAALPVAVRSFIEAAQKGRRAAG